MMYKSIIFKLLEQYHQWDVSRREKGHAAEVVVRFSADSAISSVLENKITSRSI